jgi:hypothetical protein
VKLSAGSLVPLEFDAQGRPELKPRARRCHAVVGHPHSGAIYRVVRRDDESFGVVVTIPDMYPATVTGFATKAAAKRWIARHKDTVTRGDFMTRRLPYRTRQGDGRNSA